MDAVAPVAGIVVVLLVIGALVGGFVFWLWTLIHAIQNDHLEGRARVIWVLAIVFCPFVGSVLYVLLKPKPASRTAPSP